MATAEAKSPERKAAFPSSHSATKEAAVFSLLLLLLFPLLLFLDQHFWLETPVEKQRGRLQQ